MIGFEGAGRRTTTRLIDGEFPKYRALLPDTAAATAEVATAPFVEAVKRVQLVSVVAARNAPVVRLSFSADGVVLEAGGQDDAQASERLDCVLGGRADVDRLQPELPARRPVGGRQRDHDAVVHRAVAAPRC